MIRPVAVHAPAVILDATDAQSLARTIFAAADLATRHGARIDPRVLNLATDLISATGQTEPVYVEAEEHIEHEQIDTTTAAAMLGCTGRNVRALAAQKRLPGTKNGGQWWFNRNDVEAFRDFKH
ncbi:helix-turn-helix domain-containing protein [Corynebacterium coyleae]|uniref:helix-turn-helix domain-containing protein n=1 Tax=Corynebacterium coyleae TaxID=53374 RepID=UPI00254B2BBA|nr:helix-turn-helix domain-containing protein [Corynebacterium coyleae]MDK8800412.1 helix-turn-helix domain-containing protein [Corynebacterium coyleae]